MTTYYRGKYSDGRVRELMETLRRNVENKLLHKVHVLWEDESPGTMREFFQHVSAGKMVLHRVRKQPTYHELFEYANGAVPRGDVAIIANSDIYFDDSLECVVGVDPGTRFIDPGYASESIKRPMLALTRRRAAECGPEAFDYPRSSIRDLCEHYIGSHDIFVFAPPLEHAVTRMLNHSQNLLGAENVVLWEVHRTRTWRLTNPCKLVFGYHLHCSQERTYGREVRVSSREYNGGVRKHGYVRPYQFRRLMACPMVMW